jgi:hypothetical protein
MSVTAFVVAVVVIWTLACVVLTESLRHVTRPTPKQEKSFNGMAGRVEKRASAGNAGMRPATHTGNSTPRPVVAVGGALRAPGAE